MPLAYQAAPGGYQKYKLPADKRVYQRREFDYAEENKVGDVVAVKERAADVIRVHPAPIDIVHHLTERQCRGVGVRQEQFVPFVQFATHLFRLLKSPQPIGSLCVSHQEANHLVAQVKGPRVCRCTLEQAKRPVDHVRGLANEIELH